MDEKRDEVLARDPRVAGQRPGSRPAFRDQSRGQTECVPKCRERSTARWHARVEHDAARGSRDASTRVASDRPVVRPNVDGSVTNFPQPIVTIARVIELGHVTDRKPPFRYAAYPRVGFSDTDAQGVVYYGRYLPYFDLARTEYHRHLGRVQPRRRRLRDARVERRVRRRRAVRRPARGLRPRRADRDARASPTTTPPTAIDEDGRHADGDGEGDRSSASPSTSARRCRCRTPSASRSPRSRIASRA